MRNTMEAAVHFEASGGADDSVTRPVQVLSWVLRFSRMEPVASDSTLLLRMAESMGRLSVVSGEWCGEDTATTSTEFFRRLLLL